jgi:hypothetical protein
MWWGMRRKFQVDMSPTELAELQRVASVRRRSRADTIRTLVHEAHESVVRGETAGSVDGTKRGDP